MRAIIESALIPKSPCIVDPGNGPRVKDMDVFLSSSFAAPPAMDDPMCAEFARDEVLQMLLTVLPEEMAMVLWYNKSRSRGRICPACLRLYNLGDLLPDHSEELKLWSHNGQVPELEKEKELSGICSSVCFIAASYNYPEAIRSTWGRTAEELDDQTWEFLNTPGGGHDDMGLGLLLRMSRLHDLGLAQLCFPDENFDSDGSESDQEIEIEKFHQEDMDIVCMSA
ncbi:hypothetical protein NEOLEDRAFT_1065960 [Neolentinus lepideus HHB14362 ss-1]|uniref:Uncharacterized protein n=1 Tax=Neolentinus lepideus HHB14362 ss-1 TaxID=1314782 RepID=A0A165SCH7_9AGAM|nr:hypothetical protein NEOLEDRAFT_1065960 [Neolentinus lepideus HHB14362 ss-1]